MTEKEIPKELLEKMTFEEFQEECKRVFALSDEELKTNFPDEKDAPDELRGKYKKLLDLVTPEEYSQQKRHLKINSLKAQGNACFKEGKFADSLENYEKALALAEELSEAKDIETTLRLNIALTYIRKGQPKKAIPECEKILAKDPYNVKANFRIAAAYKAINNMEDATKFIKRIVIWPSTDAKVKELYQELIKVDPKVEEQQEKIALINELISKKSNTIKELFEKQGIVLTENEMQELLSSSEKDAVERNIEQVYMNRKLRQFFQYPVVVDLHEHMEIIPKVVEAMKSDKEHPLNKILLKENPGMTIDQIIGYIEGIGRRPSNQGFWTKKGFMAIVMAIIVAAIAYAVYRFTQKRSTITSP